MSEGATFLGSFMAKVLIFFLLSGIANYVLAMDQDESDEVISFSEHDDSNSQASHDTDEDDDSQQDIKRPRAKKIAPIPNNLVERKIEGATLKDAFDFLYDNQKMIPWGYCKVTSWLWGLTAGSCFVFGVPGWTTAGLYCRNYAGIMECSASCKQSYELTRDIPRYSQCQGHCYNQDIQTLDNPYCKVGLSLSFVPAIFFVTATCAVPITRVQHALAHRYNQSIQKNLRWQLLKARTFEEELTKEDIKDIAAMMLEKNAEFILKLAPHQALGIAEVNWPAFVQLAAEGFSKPTQSAAQNLIELYNSPDKSEIFSSQKTKRLLSKNPLMLETLIRILPEEKRLDKDIKASLIKILALIIPNTNTSTLQEIFESMAINVPITYFMDNSKHALAPANRPIQDTIARDIAQQNPDWVHILTKTLNDEDIEIDKHNITAMLGAAWHFKIITLLNECDSFIVENSIPKTLLLIPHPTAFSTAQHKNPLIHMLRVAKDFGLKKTYRSLASDIVHELNSLAIINPEPLDKLRLLEDQEIEDAAHIFRKDLFAQKLSDHQFLHWIWPQAKDIGLLRDLILDFCHDQKNAPIMNDAWDLVPEDLQEALDEIT